MRICHLVAEYMNYDIGLDGSNNKSCFCYWSIQLQLPLMLNKDKTIALDGRLVYNNHKWVKSVEVSFNNFLTDTNKLLKYSCC
jgi:hypothetical protein